MVNQYEDPDISNLVGKIAAPNFLTFDIIHFLVFSRKKY